MVVKKSEVPLITIKEKREIEDLEALIDYNLRQGITDVFLKTPISNSKIKEGIVAKYKAEGDWDTVEFRTTTDCRDGSCDHWIILK